MTTTPIRNLTLMLDTVNKRLSAVDAAEQRDDLTRSEAAPANRVWCRQANALTCAIIAEPPQNFDDVLAVLSALSRWQDLITTEDDNERDLRDLHEMTGVAVNNCVLRLASLFRPDEEPTDTQHQDLVCIGRQANRWLPELKVQHRAREDR
ncbi:hypothetical protein [Sphingomonas aracearum]|uniref:Uncharacterized protein n=1 Tax=Sphingomonas aracearum TaxID=2283317 RepID=A0A369VV99_9SPHN|nr:hypothetical protein [Sphingomonas aracearum]RDE05575.1 hypothetical protein DVW87_10100 [Sphingomonas aracearum]